MPGVDSPSIGVSTNSGAIVHPLVGNPLHYPLLPLHSRPELMFDNEMEGRRSVGHVVEVDCDNTFKKIIQHVFDMGWNTNMG